MADGKVEFELVSPERLLASRAVDMVVVPGEEGDFGVLPGHSPLLSSVRAGVILIYEGKTIADRIFVAGGFAEVTRERCTVLAEVAMPVDEIDTGKAQQELSDANDDVAAANTDHERSIASRQAHIAQAKLDAVKRAAVH